MSRRMKTLGQIEVLDFTTYSVNKSLVEVSEDKREEGMMVAMALEESSKSNHNYISGDQELTKQQQTVAESRMHLELNEWAKIEKLLHDK